MPKVFFFGYNVFVFFVVKQSLSQMLIEVKGRKGGITKEEQLINKVGYSGNLWYIFQYL